ncbi:MAG: mandelate racemase/muconate lactonizing enzyme family protein [Candidatus Dormibacteraeota bacterium]|nr:mandelate racemase/muconate lactonizing enzyme family protein [Candidatus Dormibacteraeota bacterium]
MVRLERREVVPVRIPKEGGQYEAVIVIEHDHGLQGFGEAPALAERGGSLEALVAELSAEAPPRTPAARCALETAALDLRARREGRPLSALLGGPRRSEVECCALITAGAPNLVAREVERKAAARFTAFKLKTSDNGGALDQERLGAARWAAGHAASLRLDFNGRMTSADASARLPSLAPFRLQFAEQPLPADATPQSWARLLGDSGMPLAADESLASPDLASALAEAGIVCAMKLGTLGGPVPLCELAAGARGPVTVGSSFETAIGIAAAVHAACALVPEPLACGLATGTLLDDDLAFGADLRGPRLQAPTGPGLGVELDRRALALYRLDR